MDQNQIENLTISYQKLQAQLQALSMQKAQSLAQKEEFKAALEEIEKSSGKIFVSKGGAIVEVTKEDSKAKIKDEQDSLDLRLSIIEKQYAEFSKKEQEIRSKINEMLKGGAAEAGAKG
jgi:prefoldin beta subunit